MPKGRFHCLVHPRVQLPSPNPRRSEKLGTTHPCYVSTLLSYRSSASVPRDMGPLPPPPRGGMEGRMGSETWGQGSG